MNASAIVTDTLSGHNARIFRLSNEMPLYASATDQGLCANLLFSYGVFLRFEPKKHRSETLSTALKSLVDDKSLCLDDRIVYVGSSYGIRGKASFLEIIDVKNGIEPRKEEDFQGLIGPLDK